MSQFMNRNGKPVLLKVVQAIQDNKAYLGEVDGLIGDGDHGMNMNKGFTLFADRFKDEDFTFAEGLDKLGTILLTEIGGSMGPIYGTILIEAGEAGEDFEEIGPLELGQMLQAGLKGLYEIVEAKVGDKTLVDTLAPVVDYLLKENKAETTYVDILKKVQEIAAAGRDSTKELMAKFGRSARLGERSIGVLDAGATSCCIILDAAAKGIQEELK